MTTELEAELNALLDSLDGESSVKLRKMLSSTLDIIKHVTSLIQSRQFTVTGDDSHLSIKYILGQAADIDKPRKYDFQSKNVNEEEFIRSISRMLPQNWMMSETDEQITAAISGETELTFRGSHDYQCYDCAQRLHLTLKGSNLHLSCPHVCENNGEFFVDIDFPTGEVVFGDWPDRFSEIKDEGYLDECDDGESINYIKGQRQRSEGFAKQGIFHLSVGNTSPTWYYNEATNAILIGSEGYDEEKDENIVPEGFKDMGYFCTDLWWVTMLDKSRYEEMVSKLPGERDKKYYDKDVETATIKPGRYRFYSVPRDGDDDGYTCVYAKAEYLGPCGEIPKVKHVTEGKITLSPRQFIIQNARRYPTMYAGQYEEVRFGVMDQIFNVIGNGIHSKGEFLAHISVPVGTEISDEMPPANSEKPKYMENYVRAPYPNFSQRYSLLGECPIVDIPTDWLEEMVWFYTECRKFFAGPNVGYYSYAYPAAKGNTIGNKLEDWQKIVDRRTAEGQTAEQLAVSMFKDYGVKYDGDLNDFLVRRWKKELKKVKTFISTSLREINAELTTRATVS